jgi:hypothetical protein
MKILIILFTICAFNSHAADLTFKLKGKDVSSFSPSQVKSGEIKEKEKEKGKVKASEVTLFNVFRGYERTYEGYDFFNLLDAVYGNGWREAKQISFVAADGYRQFALIPNMIRAAKDKKGFLAFSEKGMSGFTKIDKQGKQIDPGPFYLVWTNFSEADKASHADTLKWPYQLVTINLE